MHVQQQRQFASGGGEAGLSVCVCVVSSGLNNKYAYYLFISTHRVKELMHCLAFGLQLQTNVFNFSRLLTRK